MELYLLQHFLDFIFFYQLLNECLFKPVVLPWVTLTEMAMYNVSSPTPLSSKEHVCSFELLVYGL